MICFKPKLSQSFFAYKAKKKNSEKAFKGKGGVEDWTKNEKKAF